MKPKHQRLVFVTFSMIFLCAAALVSLRAFRENLVFFYSPSELSQQHIDPTRLIRIGGLVKPASVIRQPDNAIIFIVTDNSSDIEVHYQGMLPSLFREGQGVVAEGRLTDSAHFTATSILAKHDEKYMPKEVVDALKRSGRWQGGATP